MFISQPTTHNNIKGKKSYNYLHRHWENIWQNLTHVLGKTIPVNRNLHTLFQHED